jgi:phosphoesterase RecJ-like protein
MTLRRADFAACAADRNDSTGFVEIPLTIGSVRVSAVITEESPDQGEGTAAVSKISLRSKPGAGAVDVNLVSGRLGGGGHARAAGARVSMPIDEARRAFLEALRTVGG